MNYDRGTIQHLLTTYRHYYSFQRSLEQETMTLAASVQREAKRQQMSGILPRLEQIPLQNMNLNTEPLLEAGYKTLGDLYGLSASQLADINGIGKTTADAIAETVKAAVNDLKQTVPLKPGSEACSVLLKEAVRYEKVSAISASLSHLLSDSRLDEAIAALNKSHSSSLLKRLFASAQSRKDEENAVQYLAPKNRSLSPVIERLKEEYRSLDTLDWKQEYRNDPSRIEQVLETLAPGVLKQSTSNSGLDGQTAEAIRSQSASLAGLHCTLRPYQEYALKYILHQKRVLLGDEMGLGKTVEAIATMVALRQAGQSHFLVVCPASVVVNWCREIEKMSDLTVVCLHGRNLQEHFNHWYSEGGVGVTTYETTGRLSLPSSFHFGELIVDEAHYIKHASAQRSNHVKRLCGYTDRILLMTGTALENNVEEMIALVQILSPETAFLLKSRKWKVTAEAFCQAAAAVYLRRKRIDVLSELPDLTIKKEWCRLSAEEQGIYRKTLRQRNYAAIRRVSWNMVDLHKSSKANRMLELLEEGTSEGRKMIVFSFFLDTLDGIVQLLGDRCIGPLDGSVTAAKRQQMVDQFNQAPAGTVLAAQIQSGGTGLNIQSASLIVLCEPQLKTSTENQAISRAYRMGQSRDVIVYRLLAENTVDEELMNLIDAKQNVFDTFADPSAAAQQGEKEMMQEGFHTLVEREIARIETEADGNN